jgi:hypothetical protein
LFLLNHNKDECNAHQKFKNNSSLYIYSYCGVLTRSVSDLINRVYNSSGDEVRIEMCDKLLNKRPLKYHQYSLNDVCIGENYLGGKNYLQQFVPFPERNRERETVITALLKTQIQIQDRKFNLELLLNTFDCDPNKKNMCGETPLNCALQYQNTDKHDVNNVEILLKYGADPNLPDDDTGIYPLQLAYEIEKDINSTYKKYKKAGKNSEYFKSLLMNYGANPFQTPKTTRDITNAIIKNNNDTITNYYRDYDFYLYVVIILMVLFSMFLIKNYCF